MSGWTSGYVADIGYTYGNYIELNPLRARLAFLNAGLVAPEAGMHCELGFGQGVSINMHAAASGATWYGTDFNPAQAGFAQSLARVSGADTHLADQTFAEFCLRPDLPDFDSIGLHGIWSWISDENRALIVDFIGRKLKVGGALYISYNTQPGWAAMVPMRDLLTEYAVTMGAQGHGIVARIDAALAFADKLIAANPAFVRANPQVAERYKRLKEHNRDYLAHEYFNRDWLPMPFSRMAEWLAPAKLDYACPAHYLDHIHGLNLSPEQQRLMLEMPDPMLRETVRDFCVNQQFRRDYWVRGARKLDALERIEALRLERVILVQPRAGVSLKVNGSLGEASMQEAVYAPLLDALAGYQPKTMGQLEQTLAGKVKFVELVEAVMVLAGSGMVMAAQDDAVALRAKPSTDKLNAHLLGKARGGGEVNYLASPVTGGGIAVNRIEQLLLLAMSKGKTIPEELASFVWQLLAMQAQKLTKQDKTLETAEENLVELTQQARDFTQNRLPVLAALQVV